MAHNLEQRIVNGIETTSFVYNQRNGLPWHGLGEAVDGAMTGREAIIKAKADFEVAKQPIIFLTNQQIEDIKNGLPVFPTENQYISDKFANVRQDRQESLGIVSDRYGIVQNEHAFDFIDMLTSGERGVKANIETAGVLGKGERIFVTAKFGDVIKLDNQGNDIVEMYAVFTTSHDGTGAVSCMITPIRVVCNNTLNMALSNNNGRLNVRHSKTVLNRLDLTDSTNAERITQTLNMYSVYQNSLKDSLMQINKVKLTDANIMTMLAVSLLSETNKKIFLENKLNKDVLKTRSQNILNNAMECVFNGVGQDKGTVGTGLWAINGLTTYFQNGKSYGTDLSGKENKFSSLVDGTSKMALQKAYDYVASL